MSVWAGATPRTAAEVLADQSNSVFFFSLAGTRAETDFPNLRAALFGPTVLASQIPGLVGDGAANDCGAVQAGAFDKALTDGGVHLIINVPLGWDASDTTGKVYSNTRVSRVGAGRINRRSGGSSYPVLRNANPTVSGTTPTDSNIFIDDLYVYGNREGGVAGGNPATPAWDAAFYMMPELAFYGVDELHVRRCRVYDPRAYALHLANVQNATVAAFRSDKRPGDTAFSNDILHLNGGCRNIIAWGLRGTSNDDAIAILGNDGNDLVTAGTSSPTYRPGTVLSAPVVGVHVSGCRFGAVHSLCRFLSVQGGSQVFDVTLDGISGTAAYAGIFFDNFDIPGDDGTHGYWYDAIRVQNCTVLGSLDKAAIWAGVAWGGVLTVENLVAAVTGPALRIDAGATFRRVELLNPRLQATSRPAVVLNGTVADFVTSPRYLDTPVVDLFPVAAADTNLVGHPADFGGAWVAGAVGANALEIAGAPGWVYLAGADSVNKAPQQPATATWEFEVNFRRLSALASSQFIGVMLFSSADVSDRVFLAFEAGRWAVYQVTTPVQTFATLPAADGTVWPVRGTVIENGTTKTIQTKYSTDGRVTWKQLCPDAAVTTAAPVYLGLYGSRAAGSEWSSTTGHQVGAFVLRETPAA